jgi:hypothetical protein
VFVALVEVEVPAEPDDVLTWPIEFRVGRTMLQYRFAKGKNHVGHVAWPAHERLSGPMRSVVPSMRKYFLALPPLSS